MRSDSIVSVRLVERQCDAMIGRRPIMRSGCTRNVTDAEGVPNMNKALPASHRNQRRQINWLWAHAPQGAAQGSSPSTTVPSTKQSRPRRMRHSPWCHQALLTARSQSSARAEPPAFHLCEGKGQERLSSVHSVAALHSCCQRDETAKNFRLNCAKNCTTVFTHYLYRRKGAQ
jgi:hypothetical protein